MGTALKRVPDHVGDVWLIVTDFAERSFQGVCERRRLLLRMNCSTTQRFDLNRF